MNIKITGTGIYLPPYIETSKETAKLINKSEEWIISKTGVTERRKRAEKRKNVKRIWWGYVGQMSVL